MRRTRGTIFLVLAYLTALVAPLRSGWACPDGTPCVEVRRQRFKCAGNQCATAKSCCEKQHPLACKHGATPSAQQGGHQSALHSPEHCRYSVTEPPQLIAQLGTGTAVIDTGDALPFSLTGEMQRTAAGAIRLSALTLGYRPPPLLESGPSRAPPFD